MTISQSRRTPRRLATFGAVALTSMTLVAACGGGGGGGGLGTAGGDSGGGGDTLVIATSQAPWNPAYAAVVEKYEQDTGNQVDLRPFPGGDVKTQQVNDIQGQQHLFDIFQINEPDMVQFMSNKWVQPFADIDPSYTLDPAINTYDNLPYWDDQKKIFTEGGELTSAPLNGNLLIFTYRKDLYDKAGLEVPTSWDQIVTNGQQLQSSGDAVYGGAFVLQGQPGGVPALSYYFEPILAAMGGTFFAEEGVDWTPTLDTPEALKAAEMLRQLATIGPSATTTMGQGQATAAVQSGEAAQSYLVSAAAGALESESDSSVAGKLGYAPLPAGPDGVPASASGIWSLAVPAGLDADRSKKALEFIKYVTSKDAQQLFASQGGVTIRSDVDPSTVEGGLSEAMTATAESAKGAVGQFRYAFATDMLTLTEPALANIAAGTVSPADGMAQLQTQITELVNKQGLPTSGG